MAHGLIKLKQTPLRPTRVNAVCVHRRLSVDQRVCLSLREVKDEDLGITSKYLTFFLEKRIEQLIDYHNSW